MTEHRETFPSDADFPDALRWAVRTQGLSLRKLAARTKEVDPTGKGLHQGFLSDVINRKEIASPRSIELIANTLGIPPCLFAEHRLAVVRRAFDDRELGLTQALSNLEALRGWLAGHERSRLGRELAEVIDCPRERGSEKQPDPAEAGQKPGTRRRRRPQTALTDDPAER